MLSKIEFVIIIMAAVAVVGAYILALNKLFRSKLSSTEKILWTLIMLLFNLLGLVAFLIYHDYYLRREFRTDL
jgi:hypothetical protein